MRSIKFILLLSGIWLSMAYTYAQPQKHSGQAKTLILAHPTLSNLQRFITLIENDIFPLPAHYQIVGVFHAREAYDYTKVESYLQEHKPGRKITLVKLECELELQEVFDRQNPCSQNFQDLFEQSSGIIFPGGADMLPAVYGASQDLLSLPSDPYRSLWETSLMYHLLGGGRNDGYNGFLTAHPDYVILGICLGMQTMNVATGGTLIQDIPSQVYGLRTVEEVLSLSPENQHRNYHRDNYMDQTLSYYCFHPIRFSGASLLSEIAGSTFLTPNILSSHHQCIGELGKQLKAVATSMDEKVIEAVVHTLYPKVLGVQFHPELPEIYYDRPAFAMRPGEDKSVFHETFPGEMGTDFHVNFWLKMASWFE